MAKYKVLKSVAHNTGHSLLGATNWYRGDFPFRHLSRAMRSAAVSQVKIDLLRGTFDPAEIRNAEVIEFAELGRLVLQTLLGGEGWTPEQMHRATFYLDLDARECRVEIEDDRGQVHVGKVVDWGFDVAAS